ncbi:MAG: hypothetical protein UHU21_08870 [Lachnospiraceae bacterium]|nr:hypothetical protein [Lachnospiraceae bacterium]
MDLEHVQRLAQAFAQGVAFARGFTEMAQDAKDGEEEGHWVTIGGERGADGEKHGGRPVFISGSGVIKKGLSRSAQGKTLGQVFGKGGEFSSEGGKGGRGETAREAGERASTKRAEAEKDRKDATSRAKEFRQETKQIVANDLEPSVAKLKKALDANVPARVHDDLVDTHRLADQIGIMANKLCSLNSRWAENSKEPSAFVVSSHGQNAKGTAERVAKLARQSAAMAHDFGKPRDERSYSDAQATSAIRDNLSELRGLHQDLLDHIRRIQEPEKREEPQEDPLYAARGKVINGPAKASATAKTTRATPATPSANLSADDKKALKQIKDLVPEIGPVFHQAKSDLEFYSPSEKKGILKEVRFSDAHVTENIKYLNELEGYVKREKEVRALAKDLNAAIKAGKLTPEDRNIYVRNLEYGFNELTKGIQRGAQALYDYAERANRGGYVSKIDDQWIRGAVRQARGGLIHITWTANKLKELK